MEKKKPDAITIIMLIVAAFTIILQIFPPETPADKLNSVLYFFAILFYVGIMYVLNNITDKVKSYINKINTNEEKITKIKKQMEIEKKFNKMDKRISILENKKGQLQMLLNPRVILLIILFVLFFLYLRSLGLIG